MLILLTGKFRKIPVLLNGYEKARNTRIEISSPEEYRKELKSTFDSDGERLIYLDAESFTPDEMKREIRFLQRKEGCITAIYDPKGKAEDPAAWFHLGISDYIGKNCGQDSITSKRIRQIIEFSKKNGTEETSPAAEESKSPAPKAADSGSQLVPDGDWARVKKGRSYVFCFMFVELDLTSEWKKKSGQTHLKRVKETFLKYIQNAVTPINGRIWMWNEYGGLVLFPYCDGPCPMVLTSAKLMINRAIASCEDFQFKTSISYRIGLHIGETVYQERGKTGTIISDTVNFIFHLGQKFAEPGNLYITKPVYELTGTGLKELFVEEGTFEERIIYRLRKTLD